MSGGVDSAVVSWLMTERGYEVVGLYVGSWNFMTLQTDWSNVSMVAQHAKIQVNIADFSPFYKRYVLGSLIRTYAGGGVPNPDILCNYYIKFGALVSYAGYMGCDILVTGHYSRMLEYHQGQCLAKSHDNPKDQSYFLYLLTNQLNPKVSFPLGNILKVVVRRIASCSDFPNANLRDSRGICLINPEDHANFLMSILKVKYGPVKDTSGDVIGEHIGVTFYTTGQKRSLSLRSTTRSPGNSRVLSKRQCPNDISVTLNPQDLSLSFHLISTLATANPTLCTEQTSPPVSCKVRSQQSNETPCATFIANIEVLSLKFPGHGKRCPSDCFTIMKTTSAGVVLGQHVVFSRGKFCIGGGIITNDCSCQVDHSQ